MDVAERTDIDILEMILLEDDPHCGSSHRHCPGCTHKVVARKMVTCDGNSFLICERSRQWNMDLMASEIHCSNCDRHVSECFIITPV